MFLGRSRAQYDALSAAQRAEADAAIRSLEQDPWEDGRTKASIVVAPLVLSVYDDGRWQII